MLYIISGFGGSLLSALFIKASISVGASGALFGLLGGMLSELITNWTIYANKVMLVRASAFTKLFFFFFFSLFIFIFIVTGWSNPILAGPQCTYSSLFDAFMFPTSPSLHNQTLTLDYFIPK